MLQSQSLALLHCTCYALIGHMIPIFIYIHGTHTSQRLTRSLPGTHRDAILADYIANDLLGCHGNQDAAHAMLLMLQSQDPTLRQQTARLFNTFSSLSKGRGYLSEALPITKALLDMLYGEGPRDTPTRRNALGAVQKLSLR